MLSDCEKCWDTPCTCGWDYRAWHRLSIINLRGKLRRVLKWQRGVDKCRFCSGYKKLCAVHEKGPWNEG